MAEAVAKAIGAALDVILLKKLGAPGNPEFAIGSVASEDTFWVDQALVRRIGADEAYLSAEIKAQSKKVKDRRDLYFGGSSHDLPPLDGRDAVIVDDGLATGASARMAGLVIRKLAPKRLVLAVPVSSPTTLEKMKAVYDVVICPYPREDLYAVGQFYDDFTQVEDAEVQRILQEHLSGPTKPL